MKLYGQITTSKGKVIGKGDNKSLKIEVLDEKQNVVFTQTFISDYKCCVDGCKNRVAHENGLCNDCIPF
jgi:hypothetical protein